MSEITRPLSKASPIQRAGYYKCIVPRHVFINIKAVVSLAAGNNSAPPPSKQQPVMRRSPSFK
jgi:hypothetical protein